MTITVALAGDVVAKARPRFTRQGHVYTPKHVKSYEDALGMAGKAAMRGNPPLEGPLHATVIVILKPPKSWTKKKTTDALEMRLHPAKPDIDNYVKVAFDGLNQIVFGDDAQIAELQAVKKFGEEPGIKIIINSLGEQHEHRLSHHRTTTASRNPSRQSTTTPASSSNPRLCRIPDGFEPHPRRMADLQKEFPKCNVVHELDKMKEHYKATGSPRADWNAQFRFWLLNGRENKNGKTTSRSYPTDTTSGDERRSSIAMAVANRQSD